MIVRVAGYNVRALRDDVPALLRVVRALRADVLCVQEAPRFLCWRRERRKLARAAGLIVAAGRRVGGVAVLTGPGVTVLADESRVLRRVPRLERRALAVAVVEVGGVRLAVGSMHLDLSATARLDHAHEILAHMDAVAARHGARVVLAGDVNEQAHQETWRHLAGRLTDCWSRAPRGDGHTYSARAPRMRIDAIFADPDVSVISCGGCADAAPADLAAATDHLPVVAELSLDESAK
jgi:endonuclease/exonuclease/phosphatase family metal-dependent hydrolase